MKRFYFVLPVLASALLMAAPNAGKAPQKPAAAAATGSPNILKTSDFENPSDNDNLWDGVNRDGEIQLLPIEVYFTDNGRSINPGRLGNPICYADADGDGRDDLVMASECGFIWLFPRANKKWPPKFESGRFLHAFFGCAVTGLDVRDMDGDGLQDIVVGSDNGRIFFLKGRGNGFFNVQESSWNFLNCDGLVKKDDTMEAYVGRQLSPRIYDWDGDGNHDLIYGEGSYSANAIYILFNKGSNASANFRNQKAQWLCYGYGREQLSPTIADLDGDGKPDILAGALDGGLHLYLNAGFKADQTDSQYLMEFARTASFADTPDNFFGRGPRPYLADLDGDRKLDLLVSAENGKVYAAKFVGQPGRCEFSKPVVVKAADRRKPYPGPPKNTWYGHHEADSYRGWNPARYGGNTGCNIMYCKETDPITQETYAFARAYYEDGYLGTDSYFGKYYDDNTENAEYGVPYRLSFKARGQQVKPVCIIRQIYEKKVVGDHIETTSPGKDYEFSVNGEWTQCSYVFTPEFVSNRREHPSVNVSFKMRPDGTNAFLDIRDISLVKQEKAGGENE